MKLLQSQEKSSTIKVRENRAVCPVCGALTRIVILPETVVINFPLYCHRCRRTTIINYRRLSDNA
ncbi:MAG: cysteine-rich KTR domain-containing protein [Oscillospiraceae bacterium]